MVSIDESKAGDGKPFNAATDSRLGGGRDNGRRFNALNTVAAYPIGKDMVVWGGRNGREWAAGVEVKF